MSRSIGSYYPIVYKKGIYRLPYFVGKARTPNWDFVRNLLVRAKIASNLLVASKDRELQDQHGVHRISHSGSCNGTVQWLRAQRVCVWNGDKGTAAALPLQRHFNADEVATPACPCVVYIYSSLWSAGATPRLKT